MLERKIDKLGESLDEVKLKVAKIETILNTLVGVREDLRRLDREVASLKIRLDYYNNKFEETDEWTEETDVRLRDLEKMSVSTKVKTHLLYALTSTVVTSILIFIAQRFLFK